VHTSSRQMMLHITVSVLAPVGVLAAVWGLTIGRRLSSPAIQPTHKQITFTGNVVEASLSPDGQSIAFISERGHQRRLLVRDVSGGPSLEVAHAEGDWAIHLSNPRWSPNGSQLIYAGSDSTTDEGRPGTFLVSRLGGHARRLMDHAEHRASSPDGSQL